MAQENDSRDVSTLLRQRAELQARVQHLKAVLQEERARVQTVRQETIDLMKNASAEQVRELEEDAARSRGRLREKLQEIEHLMEVVRSCSLRAEQMVVEPLWPANRAIGIDSNVAFLLMPFEPTWAESVWEAIERALDKLAMQCVRADEKSRVVMIDIWKGLYECGVVLADLTDGNPNVAHEVGLADAIGKKVLLISQTKPEVLPFATSEVET